MSVELSASILVVFNGLALERGHNPRSADLWFLPSHTFQIREMKTLLLANPPPDQKEWRFFVSPDQIDPRKYSRPGKIFGKRITFTADAITLEIGELSNNRILQDDDPSQFIAVSFGGLRFRDAFLRVTGEYIQKLMETGLYLNDTQYRFYHHSNSQLVRPLCIFAMVKSHGITARAQLLHARREVRCRIRPTNLRIGRV